jgi:hypothetical protein
VTGFAPPDVRREQSLQEKRAMENTTRSDAILPSEVPKAPVTVLLLNLFFVCIGYFLIGQWQKGIAGAVAFLLELAIVIGSGLVTLGFGACFVVPLALAFHAALVIDGYLQAQMLKDGHAIGQWTFVKRHL